jgi:hypothetical protein
MWKEVSNLTQWQSNYKTKGGKERMNQRKIEKLKSTAAAAAVSGGRTKVEKNSKM